MADIIGFEKPGFNLKLSDDMHDLLIEVLFGVYDVTMCLAKDPVTIENAKRASDTLRHITSSVQQYEPEQLIDVLLSLISAKATGSSVKNIRHVALYNEAKRIKDIFIKERKATLN